MTREVLMLGLTNAAIAVGLAALVAIALRWRHNAQLAAVLWTLILIKLVSPPLAMFSLERPWESQPAETAVTAVTVNEVQPVVEDDVATVAEATIGAIPEPDRLQSGQPAPESSLSDEVISAIAPPIQIANADEAPQTETFSIADRLWTPGFVATMWLGGALVALMGLIVSGLRFRRVIQSSELESDEAALIDVLGPLSRRWNLRHPPRLRVVDARISPLLWTWFDGTTLVIPRSLLALLSPSQREMMLAHELAHFRRGDHLFRWLEVIVQSLYWWLPVVPWMRRQLHAAQEECCDTFVRQQFPDQGVDYCDTLLTTATWLHGVRPSPLFASELGNVNGLKRRIRNMLERQTTPPLSRRALSSCIVLGLFACAISVRWVSAEPLVATAVAINNEQGAPIEQQNDRNAAGEPALAAADNDTDLPSLEELKRALAVHEQAYLPYHVTSMQTFVMSDGLTDEERSRFPWADGRKHQHLWENAQLKPGTWMSTQTMIVDDVFQNRYDQYVDNFREVGVQQMPGHGVSVNLQNPKRPARAYGWTLPLSGVFPLNNVGDSLLLSVALGLKETTSLIEADGSNAKLTVVAGPESARKRVILWLSRAHAWHPVRFQRIVHFEADRLLSEWEALRLEKQDSQWRVIEGNVQWFNAMSNDPDQKKTYSLKFEIQAARYGDAVSPELFKYQVPSDAVVHDPTAPLTPAPELTRDFPVTVIDVHGRPVQGATVTSRSRGLKEMPRDLVDVLTDERGLATVRVPDGDFGLRVHNDPAREASWIIGSGTNEMRVILAPVTGGKTLDDHGTALSNVWVSSESDVYFRSDGLISDPRNNGSVMERSAFSDAAGDFQLTSELTLRRVSDSVLISAIDADQDRMAFVHVPASQLAEPLNVTLLPVCAVDGSCVLEGLKEPTEVWLSIEDTEGRELANVTPATSVVEQGLRVAFKFRLPPGEYRLQSRNASVHSTISIPIRVPKGEHELHLKPQLIRPSGVQALIGKPAPELEGTWRSGDGITLAGLRGNVVVLDFWGYWCGPCVSSMPFLMDLADQFKDQPVKWLAIHDPHDLTQRELEERLAAISRDQWKGRELTFPVLIDAPSGDDQRSGFTGQQYDVREWPTLILIDRDGNVAGAATHANLRERIEALLPPGEQAPPTDAVSEVTEKAAVEDAPQAGDQPESDVERVLQGGHDVLTPANLAEIRLLTKVNRFAYQFAWSPDGQQVVFVPWEGTAEFRDANTLALLPGVQTGPRTIHIEFGPSAGLMAYAENDRSQSVHILDQNTGNSRTLATEYRQPGFDFSPDGSLIATGGYGTKAHVWSVQDGKLLHTLDMGNREGGLTPVFSPDGSIIAVGNRNSTTRLFDAMTGALRTEFRDRSMSHGIAFRPQGDQVAIGYAVNRIATWSVETGKLIAERNSGADEIYNVTWSPSGQILASAGLYGDITFWSASALESLHKLEAPEWVIDISFSPDGTRLFTSGGGREPGEHRDISVWGVPDQ